MPTRPDATDGTRRPVRRLADGVATGGLSGLRAVVKQGVTWRRNRLRRWYRQRRRALHQRGLSVAESIWRAQPPAVRARLKPIVQRLNRGAGGWDEPRITPAPGRTVLSPTVSVIVTSKNRSELLGAALRSVQLQDFELWECIVIDDASTDDSVFVAQDFAAVDPRFGVLSNRASLGPSASRNIGIANAGAPWVCFLDDDDFLLDRSISERLEAVRLLPDEVAGSYCEWLNTDPEVGLEVFRTHRRAKGRDQVSFASMVRGAPFIISSPLIRREVLLEVGGFDESLTRAEDADLWLRLLRLGYRFVPVRHLGVAYRRSPGSLVMGAPEHQLVALRGVFHRHEHEAPELEGRGPLPAVRPLSDAALDISLMPQVLRYVALVSVYDEDHAVELGRQHLSEVARRSIHPDDWTRELANHVVARDASLDRNKVHDIEDLLTRVLTRLQPEPRLTWERSDHAAWVADHVARAAPVGTRPVVVTDEATVREAIADAVVLLPEARYHVDELGPLACVLRSRGQRVCFMTSPKTIETAMRELGAYTTSVVGFRPDLVHSAAAVVSLNDWGPIRDLVEKANAAGVPTFAKVEGVQDFNDDDTGRVRRAYRTASVILAQGANDVHALPEKTTWIVGSSRLERIWNVPPVDPGDHCLINVNFTYGVLTDQRDLWLGTVADALSQARLRGVISRHPAERGNVMDLEVASKPFRYEITRAGVLVSRFSTVPFEAMARGVPFVYHNPHGEKVPTFSDPAGAFRITTTATDLGDALAEAMTWRGDYRTRSEEFFRRQVDVSDDAPSEERTADVIAEVLGR